MVDFKFPLRILFGIGCLVGALLLPPLPSHAQETATLRGLVTSAEDGSALVRANVLLSTLDGEKIKGAVTNLDGYYEMGNLPLGRYRLRISYVGYRTHRDTLTLEAGPQQYDVELSPSQQQLEGVQVEAKRGATRRTAGVQTVGAADLGRIPTPGPSGDLAAYLQTLPGVVSIGDRGGQLFIRGGTPSQNLILVDGTRIMKPFHISGLYSTFPQEIVNTVDVYAGGFGAQYMGAVSSVIDVSIRKGNMKEYEGSISASPYIMSARLEGPIRKGTDSFLAVARRSLIQ
ncbi:MAG: carboxypeptidase regulatory-like domain-containing protein, partial [Salinibacter sp.]